MNPELGRWLALRRVRRGGIAQFTQDVFLDRGRPVPGYLGGFLTALLTEGHIRSGRPQESTGHVPLELTSAGEIRYAGLTACYQHQRHVQEPGPG